MIKNISAYSTGAVNADDNTNSDKNNNSGEGTTGVVSYTVPQQMKGTSLSDERVKNAKIKNDYSNLFNNTPIRTVNPK